MQDLAQWLEELGMSEYSQRFAENDIDFAILVELTDQDLEKIGVKPDQRAEWVEQPLPHHDIGRRTPFLICQRPGWRPSIAEGIKSDRPPERFKNQNRKWFGLGCNEMVAVAFPHQGLYLSSKMRERSSHSPLDRPTSSDRNAWPRSNCLTS